MVVAVVVAAVAQLEHGVAVAAVDVDGADAGGNYCGGLVTNNL